MSLVTVTCSGQIFGGGVFEPGPGAPAGTWSDGSDATYAEGNSACQLDVNSNVTRNADRAIVTAFLRWSGPEAPGVSVTELANGNNTYLTGGLVVPGGASAVPIWSSLQLGPGPDMVNFLEGVQLGGQLLHLLVGNPAGRTYEAYLTVRGPGVAPPCQLFPNDVQGAVGGAVSQYPRSKSRQRGHRVGGGHY